MALCESSYRRMRGQKALFLFLLILWVRVLQTANRVYTVRENQGKTYLFRDGQGKSGRVRESQGIQRKSQGKVGKSQGDFFGKFLSPMNQDPLFFKIQSIFFKIQLRLDQ